MLDRVVRSADLLPPMSLPGQKKAIKKPKRLVLDEVETGNGDDEVIKEEEFSLSGSKISMLLVSSCISCPCCSDAENSHYYAFTVVIISIRV